MSMRFGYHTRKRMVQRHIAAHEIAEVVENPQTTYRSEEPGKPDRIVILGATAAGRRLKVVVDAADPSSS